MLHPCQQLRIRIIRSLHYLSIALYKVKAILLPFPALELANRTGVDMFADIAQTVIFAIKIDNAYLCFLIHNAGTFRKTCEYRIAHAGLTAVFA